MENAYISNSAVDQIFGGASLRLLAWSVYATASSTSCCSSSFQGDMCCCSCSRRPFERLHDVHLPSSTSYGYIEQIHEMSGVNGATYALSNGPSARYTLFLVFMHILLLFTAYVSSDTYMHIHVVTYIIHYKNIDLLWRSDGIISVTEGA